MFNLVFALALNLVSVNAPVHACESFTRDDGQTVRVCSGHVVSFTGVQGNVEAYITR